MALGERACEVTSKVVGDKHMLTLHAMANLGGIYALKGRYAEAEVLLNRSVELAKRHFGQEHGVTVCCHMHLGILYRMQSRYEEHDAMFLDLLRTCRRSHGEDSMLADLAKRTLNWRVAKLSELGEEQTAGGDHKGAAATMVRLEEIRQALRPSPERQADDDCDE